MEQILLFLPNLLGLDPEMAALALGVLVAIANLVGKAIPDSATGPLGIVRKVCKVLGLYIGNKVTPTINNNDVARAVAATVPDLILKDAAQRLPEAVRTGEAAGEVAESIIATVRGDQPSRPYVPGESPEPGSIVPEEYRTDPFRAGAKNRKG